MELTWQMVDGVLVPNVHYTLTASAEEGFTMPDPILVPVGCTLDAAIRLNTRVEYSASGEIYIRPTALLVDITDAMDVDDWTLLKGMRMPAQPKYFRNPELRFALGEDVTRDVVIWTDIVSLVVADGRRIAGIHLEPECFR